MNFSRGSAGSAFFRQTFSQSKKCKDSENMLISGIAFSQRAFFTQN